MAKATAKKRKVIVESTGEAHISATFNNIIISLTNKKGEVISWSSAGKMGFRGSKKNTPYAAQMAAEDCSKVALEAGLKKVKVYVKAPGTQGDHPRAYTFPFDEARRPRHRCQPRPRCLWQRLRGLRLRFRHHRDHRRCR
jgi:ribosomal protein S11